MILRRSAFFVACALFSVLSINTASAQSCPSSSRPIKAGEFERAAALGIKLTPGTPCIDNRTAGWLDAGMDKDSEFFNTRICKGKTAGLPADFIVTDTSPENWNRIRKDDGYVYFTAPDNSMNPGAMRCFKEFFEKMEAQGYKPCVNSALRSLAHQRASCRATANDVVCGRSNRGSGPVSSCPNDLSAYKGCEHVNGLAMDIGDKDGRVNAVLAKARGFTGFSKVGAGKDDPWHVVAGNCADANFKPSLNPADTWNGAAASPTAGFANTMRSVLGMQPAQPAFSAQPASSQQIASTQSPLSSFSTLPTPLVSDTLVDTGTLATKNSIADRLENLAFGSRATSTQGATSVPLVINGNDRGGVGSSNNQGSSATTSGLGGAITQSTFTSQDLNNQFAPAIPQSTFQATLSILKTALLKMLEYLKPFTLRSSN